MVFFSRLVIGEDSTDAGSAARMAGIELAVIRRRGGHWRGGGGDGGVAADMAAVADVGLSSEGNR